MFPDYPEFAFCNPSERHFTPSCPVREPLCAGPSKCIGSRQDSPVGFGDGRQLFVNGPVGTTGLPVADVLRIGQDGLQLPALVPGQALEYKTRKAAAMSSSETGGAGGLSRARWIILRRRTSQVSSSWPVRRARASSTMRCWAAPRMMVPQYSVCKVFPRRRVAD